MFQPSSGHLQGVHINYVSGYQSVVRGSQGLGDQFPGDPRPVRRGSVDTFL
jgi:hypothetical protein